MRRGHDDAEERSTVLNCEKIHDPATVSTVESLASCGYFFMEASHFAPELPILQSIMPLHMLNKAKPVDLFSLAIHLVFTAS
jgi:hypothetical protein